MSFINLILGCALICDLITLNFSGLLFNGQQRLSSSSWSCGKNLLWCFYHVLGFWVGVVIIWWILHQVHSFEVYYKESCIAFTFDFPSSLKLFVFFKFCIQPVSLSGVSIRSSVNVDWMSPVNVGFWPSPVWSLMFYM